MDLKEIFRSLSECEKRDDVFYSPGTAKSESLASKTQSLFVLCLESVINIRTGCFSVNTYYAYTNRSYETTTLIFVFLIKDDIMEMPK